MKAPPVKIAWALLPVLAAVGLLTACARESPSGGTAPMAAAPQMPARDPQPVAVSLQNHALPVAVAHKSPTCGCCELWVVHLRQAGFQVEVRSVDNLNPVKERLGVPYGKGSCHTAEIGGYVIEGHVPATDIKRLLAEKPSIRGLALPGMPLGSPGMEVPGGTTQPYTVELIRHDGSTAAYADHGF